MTVPRVKLVEAEEEVPVHLRPLCPLPPRPLSAVIIRRAFVVLNLLLWAFLAGIALGFWL